MYSYVRITIRRHLDRSLWLWETIAAFVVPISLASTPTRTTTPTPTPQPQKLPYENLTQLKRSIAITVLQAPSSGIMGATHRAHDQDEDEMEIDPRLRDTPVATSYTPQTHPPRASLQTPIAPQQSRSPVAPQQYQPVQEGSPQNYYLPQTPQSGGNEDNDAGNGTQDGGPNDPKRPRACEACKF
jgi:hypothetical protein